MGIISQPLGLKTRTMLALEETRSCSGWRLNQLPEAMGNVPTERGGDTMVTYFMVNNGIASIKQGYYLPWNMVLYGITWYIMVNYGIASS